MHIPKGNTAGIEVLAFSDALKEALQEQTTYDVGKWLYVPCRYDEYRYKPQLRFAFELYEV